MKIKTEYIFWGFLTLFMWLLGVIGYFVRVDSSILYLFTSGVCLAILIFRLREDAKESRGEGK